jgi:hypothetical protein
MLREMYREFDGFGGPMGTCFLYPLLLPQPFSKETLVGHTLFLRGEEYFPVFLHKAVVYGDFGNGPYWGVLLDTPDKVFVWDAEWGDQFDVLEGTPLDAWEKHRAALAEAGHRART